MSPKRAKFIDEYLIDLNATQAAKRAGYAVPDREGHRLLKNAEIAAEVERRRAAISERTGLTVAALDAKLLLIIQADKRLTVKEDGSLKKIHELGDAEAAALTGFDHDELFEGRGEDREHVGFTRKLRFADTVKALEVGYRRLGVLREGMRGPEGGAFTLNIYEGCDDPGCKCCARKYPVAARRHDYAHTIDVTPETRANGLRGAPTELPPYQIKD